MSSRPSRGAARLAAILDALPDALVLVNCNGTVVNANTIALERLEAPGTALVGRGLLDLLPEFDSRLIPGSMRRPDTIDEQGRTRPTRMTARRTDGAEFPVEVTSASLAEGREPGWGAPSQFGAGAADQRYTGDELLMIVVRDLSGAVDTEAELARSQRQTEMILRAAAEGVVGTDTDGRVVLVNPAAAQILGFRAGDLGGREFHTLVLHSRADGEPFPYAESPLADTLRSGRKHRVRGQVLWAKDGSPVPVDLTTAPVRDGDQLVGAVVTFTDRRAHEALVAEHAEELAAAEKRYEELAEREQRRYEELETSSTEKYEKLERTSRERYEELERTSTEKYQELERASRERYETLERESTERYEALAEREKERYAALGEREKDRYEALAARHDQLVAVLSESLRGPLDHLRSELGSLAADPAGQLWPEANQILHHLSARLRADDDPRRQRPRLPAARCRSGQPGPQEGAARRGHRGWRRGRRRADRPGPGPVRRARPVHRGGDRPAPLRHGAGPPHRRRGRHRRHRQRPADPAGHGGRVHRLHGRRRGGPARQRGTHRGARPVRGRRPGARAAGTRHRPGPRRRPPDPRHARHERQRLRPRHPARRGRRGGPGPAAGRTARRCDARAGTRGHRPGGRVRAAARAAAPACRAALLRRLLPRHLHRRHSGRA
ncbi:PAS domain-containing protein [Actinomadura keratinilytica]